LLGGVFLITRLCDHKFISLLIFKFYSWGFGVLGGLFRKIVKKKFFLKIVEKLNPILNDEIFFETQRHIFDIFQSYFILVLKFQLSFSK